MYNEDNQAEITLLIAGGQVQKDESEGARGTQARLLEAALDIFGRDGYAAATTRVIAREAGVNIAAIPYYYRGKEGLYRAVVSHIAHLVRQEIDESIARIECSSFTGEEGRGKAWHELEALLATLINFMIGSSQGVRVARIILREQMYPTAAYDFIFNDFMAPVMNILASLIMSITGNNSERRAKMRALAIVGQIMAFRVARESIVRSLDLDGYNAAEMEEISDIILEHTRSILNPLR